MCRYIVIIGTVLNDSNYDSARYDRFSTHTYTHTHSIERRPDYGHYFNINIVANPEVRMKKKKTPSLLVHTRKQQQYTHTQTLKAVERSIKFDESVLRFFTHKIDDGKIFSNPTRNKDGEWKPNPKRSFRGL